MSALIALFARFHDAVENGAGVAALADLRPHPRLTQAQQMAIYSDGYRIRLTQAIRSDYPALLALLGEEKFAGLAGRYVTAHPSTGYNLDRYPHGFAAFAQSGLGGFAGELAVLEGTIAEVFMLPESGSLAPETCAGLAPEAFGELRLPLRTASRLLRFSYPVEEWFAAQRAGEASPAPAPRETFLYVWRHHHEVRRANLDEPAWLLLKQLGQGATLAEALGAIGHEETVAANLQGWFARWVSDGFLAAGQKIG